MNVHSSENELKEATSKAVLLWPFVNGKKLTRAAIRDLRSDLECSRATIFRYVRLLKKTGDAASIIPRKSGRKEMSTFLSPKAEKLIDKRIAEVFLSKERISIEELYKRTIADFQCEGEPMVARKTIMARVNTRSPRDICKNQLGAKEAKEKYSLVKQRYIVEEPLSVVQIDHTIMDVMAVSNTSRTALGRPTLTMCLDVASRTICGFQISMSRPNSMSLMTAFSAAVLPKTELLEELGLSESWPVYGIPKAVHTDNGSDLVSTAFTLGLERWGIEHIRRPVGAPNWGGHVERLFRTLNSYIHSFPGTTKSNIADRGRSDPAEKACLTLAELRMLTASYICKVYHRSRHDALNSTPLQVWERYWDGLQEQPQIPKDVDQFRIHFMPTETGAIGKYGIRFKKQHFRSVELQKFRDCGMGKVRFRYDPEDARFIFVEGPNGKHVKIPSETPFKTRISFSELAYLDEPVATNSNRWSDADLIRHYRLHDEIIKSARSSKRGSNRIAPSKPIRGALRPDTLPMLHTPKPSRFS